MDELISPDVGKQIKQALSAMEVPVRLLVFIKEDGDDCQFCGETRQLVEEIASLHDDLSFEIFDIAKDQVAAETYQVDKVPAIGVMRFEDGLVDYGLRLYGIPAGYEFSSFIEDILMVSRGKHGLSDKTVERIALLDRPVHIQVYVTPT
jgi:glutaredoxin-like protein